MIRPLHSFAERDKPIYEGILSEKPLSLLDLVHQGNKGILVGGEKLLDVSYGEGAKMQWWISYGNETGGSDREQHFVTHDRRAYLESGDVSNRLQSPNMWKVKRKTNVYLLFLSVEAPADPISPHYCFLDCL